MNEQLEKFARDSLKTDLATCTEGQQMLFKRMYSPAHRGKSLNQVTDDMTINQVVEAMPIEKLDWAMQQVQRTAVKNATQDQSA